MMNNYLAILEGLLFIKGDEGVSIDEISYCLEIPTDEANLLITELKELFDKNESGLDINVLNGKYRFITRTAYANYYSKVLENPITQKLSNAALETLAIIAYEQPITRIQISEIRGVNSEGIVRSLIARMLIKEVGVLDVVGKPIIYGTTDEFLDLFNLKSLDDLPDLEYFSIDGEKEFDLFTLKYQEESVDEPKS